MRIGDSQAERGTFRGYFFESVLELDAVGKTIRLAEGPSISFDGDETDLRLVSEDGEALYLDVTRIAPRFRGDVQVEVMGRVRRVFTGDRIAQ